MGKIKVSLISTVLNEESSIEHFLSSIAIQSYKPDEIIVVDGGSTDKTVAIIKSFQPLINNLQIIEKQGVNRSKGRNIAIKQAKNETIAISDGGCVLDRNWLLEITKPFYNNKTSVVAGYYKGNAKTIFEECVVPYVLIMPDKINPNTFLPSSRSMALKKSVWKKTGGFPEDFNDNEDFVFANILKKKKIPITFSPEAIIYWNPRKNLKEFWVMIYRFARGDTRAGLRRLRVATFFLRYVFLIFFGLSCLIFYALFKYFLLSIFLYLSWSVYKNYRYIKDPRAFYLLPILQITSDLAIITGSIVGGLISG